MAEHKDAAKIIDDLRNFLFGGENYERYFPKELKDRYELNFKLFDRDNDGAITYTETFELLRSIN